MMMDSDDRYSEEEREDNNFVAINENGNIVFVTQPIVKELKKAGTADESFNTESSSIVSNDDDDDDDESEENNNVSAGPFSGFRRRRAERIAQRASLREERQRAVEERKKRNEERRRKSLEDQRKIKEAIPERLLQSASLVAGCSSTTTPTNNNNNNGESEMMKEEEQELTQTASAETATTETSGSSISSTITATAAMRARTISVTVVKNKSNSYGLGLVQVLPRRKNTVEIEALVNDNGSTLLSDSPICVGDVLKTVNDEIVQDHRTVMLKLMNMDGPVTIVVEPPTSAKQQQQEQSTNPALVHAFFRKPKTMLLPAATSATNNDDDNNDDGSSSTTEEEMKLKSSSSLASSLGIKFEIVEHSTTQNDLCDDPSGSKEITTTKLLQIKNIDPNGYFASSVLSVGDFVLTINGVSCSSTSTTDDDDDDITTVTKDAINSIKTSETISIVALNPKLAQQHCSPTRAQRWMRTARRASVGAVGGSMRK